MGHLVCGTYVGPKKGSMVRGIGSAMSANVGLADFESDRFDDDNFLFSRD